MQDALLVLKVSLKDSEITVTVISAQYQQRPHLRNVLKVSVVLKEGDCLDFVGQRFKVTMTN